MTLYEKIMQIYPELQERDFRTVIEIYAGVDGEVLTKWEHPTLAQPTQEQLDAVGES